MANEMHVGDIGTVITVTVQDAGVAIDISAATVKQLILRNPARGTVVKDASFVGGGSAGQLSYTTVTGDLSQDGEWQLQALITLPSGTWRSTYAPFYVYENL